MRKTILAAVISAAAFISLGLVQADEWDKKTTITVNETILIPGRSLPPGKYVMKLATIGAERHIVQIMNADETKVEATILAFNNERLKPTGKTVLRYWETPAGTPPALRAWFYPGDNFGQEFAYPKATADQISRQNNNEKVPSYADSASEGLDANNAAKLEVQDMPSQSSQGSAAAADTSARQSSTASDTPSSTAQPQVVALNTTPVAQNTTPTVQTPAPSINRVPLQNNSANNTNANPDPTLLAQNTPPAQAATPAPTQLPRTASSLPMVFAIGLAALLLAFALRFAKA
jgi:hypothetical protein